MPTRYVMSVRAPPRRAGIEHQRPHRSRPMGQEQPAATNCYGVESWQWFLERGGEYSGCRPGPVERRSWWSFEGASTGVVWEHVWREWHGGVCGAGLPGAGVGGSVFVWRPGCAGGRRSVLVGVAGSKRADVAGADAAHGASAQQADRGMADLVVDGCRRVAATVGHGVCRVGVSDGDGTPGPGALGDGGWEHDRLRRAGDALGSEPAGG